MANRKLPPEVLDFFRKQGAKGGKLGGSKGGQATAANMTAEERSERARNAVAAREAKRAASAKPAESRKSAPKKTK